MFGLKRKMNAISKWGRSKIQSSLQGRIERFLDFFEINKMYYYTNAATNFPLKTQTSIYIFNLLNVHAALGNKKIIMLYGYTFLFMLDPNFNYFNHLIRLL